MKYDERYTKNYPADSGRRTTMARQLRAPYVHTRGPRADDVAGQRLSHGALD
jgi:hypothetical protein